MKLRNLKNKKQGSHSCTHSIISRHCVSHCNECINGNLMINHFTYTQKST